MVAGQTCLHFLFIFLYENIYISGTTTASNLSSSSWEQVGICREYIVKKSIVFPFITGTSRLGRGKTLTFFTV
jgi:hypothetical protein